MKILQHRKGQMAVVAIVLVILSNLAAMLGIDMTPEMQVSMAKFSTALVTLIAMGYKLAQGYADGKSGGVTSSAPAMQTPNVEAVEELSGSFFRAVKAAGLEIKQKRQAPRSKINTNIKLDPKALSDAVASIDDLNRAKAQAPSASFNADTPSEDDLKP